MNLEETTRLLGFCAAFDARTVGKADVIAWNTVVGWMPYSDAEAAVADHYSRETDFIKPAHVIAIVKRLRRTRAEGAELGADLPDADPDDVPAWIAALRAGRHRDADSPRLQRFDPEALVGSVLRALPTGPAAANPCYVPGCGAPATCTAVKVLRGPSLDPPRPIRLCAPHGAKARARLGDRLNLTPDTVEVIDGELSNDGTAGGAA